MSPFVRAAVVFLVAAPAATAATPEQIDTALVRGTGALKARFANGTGGADATTYRTGPAALAGLALLEAKTPAADGSIKAIAAAVREAAYKENSTYQIALSLIFLDRLEDPADVPLIQLLGVRLVAGQFPRGGWGYACVDNVPPADEQRLRTGLKGAELSTTVKDGGRAGSKLHPLVQEYATAIWAARSPTRTGEDNSNTQFAVLAAWTARKYAVPVEPVLELVERRFVATQDPQGGWPYTPDVPSGGTPTMTCAGLVALATAIGRREEKRLKAEAPPKTEPGKVGDPFFNPPPRPDGKGPAGPKRPPDVRDAAANRALAFLGGAFVQAVRAGGGKGGTAGGPGALLGSVDMSNLYFLWSVERVGVLYGVDKIGGIDWYASGADYLCKTQAGDGTWSTNYKEDIDTSFAVLFLCKANLARDLSNRVRGEPAGSELRAGTPTATVEPLPTPKGPVVPVNPLPVPVVAPLPAGAAGKVTADLVAAANGPGWAKALESVRDAKGADNTTGLVAAVHRLDGDKKRAARDALAERLSRMSAETLRGMISSADAELRRGAVLAAAMRDDQSHVPDLIDRITDADDLVVRAARAGLKSLTEQDFGPQPGATAADRTQAAAAWRAWWARQKR